MISKKKGLHRLWVSFRTKNFHYSGPHNGKSFTTSAPKSLWGGCFHFWSKYRPQKHKERAILHTLQANGGLEPRLLISRTYIFIKILYSTSPTFFLALVNEFYFCNSKMIKRRKLKYESNAGIDKAINILTIGMSSYNDLRSKLAEKISGAILGHKVVICSLYVSYEKVV